MNRHASQMAEQAERFFHGYIFMPCCSEDCCRNQLQTVQTLSPLYAASTSSRFPLLPAEQSSLNYETFPAPTFNYFLFPSNRKKAQLPANGGVKNGVENFQSPLRGAVFFSVRRITPLV